jgi:hypothetical protein
MFPMDYVLAVALITTPQKVAPKHLNSVFPTVLQVALNWEIADHREVKFLLIDTFCGDFELLNKRWDSLYDAPPLHDEWRFPDKQIVDNLMCLNRAYKNHLENRRSLELVYQQELNELIVEVEHLYQIWDTLRDSKVNYYYVNVRRAALKKLRESIGDEAYYNGQLPSPIPLQRLTRID